MQLKFRTEIVHTRIEHIIYADSFSDNSCFYSSGHTAFLKEIIYCSQKHKQYKHCYYKRVGKVSGNISISQVFYSHNFKTKLK